MIVRDIDIVKKYVSTNAAFDFGILKPYVAQSERKYIKSNIGKAQYAIFDVATAPSDEIVKEAYELSQEAISNFAMYLSLPILVTQITDTGVFVALNEDVTPANDKQFKELQRSCKKAAHEALDELFKLMESNLEKFEAWQNDNSYKSYSNLLVNSTSVFNRHYNIFNSRQTFMALKAEIEIVEYQFINSKIQVSLMSALKSKQDNANRQKAKELIQKAIVCYTIAKVCQNGMFVLDASSIHVRFDVLPYEKVNANINQKSTNFLAETAKNKSSEAEQFIRLALEVINDNPSDFAEFQVSEEEIKKPIIISTPGIHMI